MVFPIVAPPDPWRPWCVQFRIYIISESFLVNMTILAQWFLKRRFLNDPSHFCIFVIISPLKENWPFI
jgi:hypothetical protein